MKKALLVIFFFLALALFFTFFPEVPSYLLPAQAGILGVRQARAGDFQNPAAMLYLQSDWYVTNTNNLGWGPVGSEIKDIKWYAWQSEIENSINSLQGKDISTLDGKIIPKPLVIGIMLITGAPPSQSPSYGNNGITWDYYADYTPKQVYESMGVATGYILEAKCSDGSIKKAVVPRFDDSRWRKALHESILELGRKYADNPRISAIEINSGFDGEPQVTKNQKSNNCDFVKAAKELGLENAFNNFVSELVNWYQEAFDKDSDGKVDKPVYLHSFWSGYDLNKLKNKGIGIKINSLKPDGNDLAEYENNELTGRGVIGVGLSAQNLGVPIAYESAYLINKSSDAYFSLLGVLMSAPDFIDMYDVWFKSLAPFGKGDTPNTPLYFIQSHIGKNINETASLWIAFRDTDFKGRYTGLLGDFYFGIKRLEGDDSTVVDWKDLPVSANSLAKQQPFGYKTRKINSKPINLSFEESFLERAKGFALTYLDKGDGEIRITYRNKQGIEKTLSLTKQNKEEFKRKQWKVEDIGGLQVQISAPKGTILHMFEILADAPTLNAPPSCSQQINGDYNCDGNINKADFTDWKTDYLNNKTTLLFFEYWRRVQFE